MSIAMLLCSSQPRILVPVVTPVTPAGPAPALRGNRRIQKRISGPLLDRHRHPVRGAAHPPQPSPSESVDAVIPQSTWTRLDHRFTRGLPGWWRWFRGARDYP
jgi:hypothetical protein